MGEFARLGSVTANAAWFVPRRTKLRELRVNMANFDPMFDPLWNDPRFQKLRDAKARISVNNFSEGWTQKLARSAENRFLRFEGFRISHLAVPADVFANVALQDGHNLDPSCYA